jgi:hypothetical protein
VSDPLGFPALAGSALTQAFGFLYGRLAVLLDRRSAARDSPAFTANFQSSSIIDKSAALRVNEDALLHWGVQLEALAETLGVYHDHPELVHGQDERLRRNLGRLREALEAIYGQRLVFEGEEPQAHGVRIDQRVDEIAGEVIGIDAGEIASEAQVDVVQTSGTVKEGAKLLGAKVRRLDS